MADELATRTNKLVTIDAIPPLFHIVGALLISSSNDVSQLTDYMHRTNTVVVDAKREIEELRGLEGRFLKVVEGFSRSADMMVGLVEKDVKVDTVY